MPGRAAEKFVVFGAAEHRRGTRRRPFAPSLTLPRGRGREGWGYSGLPTRKTHGRGEGAVVGLDVDKADHALLDLLAGALQGWADALGLPNLDHLVVARVAEITVGLVVFKVASIPESGVRAGRLNGVTIRELAIGSAPRSSARTPVTAKLRPNGEARLGHGAAAIVGSPRAMRREAAARREAPQIGWTARDRVDVALAPRAVHGGAELPGRIRMHRRRQKRAGPGRFRGTLGDLGISVACPWAPPFAGCEFVCPPNEKRGGEIFPLFFWLSAECSLKKFRCYFG